MSVVFGCRGCGRGVEADPGAKSACGRCGHENVLPPAPDRLTRCLACGEEIYRHRDFNQKLGLLIVIVGVVLWWALGDFLPMVVAALIDLLLYWRLPDVAICYACKAHHRDLPGIAEVAKFDLERHEHYRFRKAREESATTEAKGGTGG